MRGHDQQGAEMVSFYFDFDWRLPTGVAVPFDAVHVARLAPDGRIDQLHLVYGTVEIRPTFEAQTGRRSWRR